MRDDAFDVKEKLDGSAEWFTHLDPRIPVRHAMVPARVRHDVVMVVDGSKAR